MYLNLFEGLTALSVLFHRKSLDFPCGIVVEYIKLTSLALLKEDCLQYELCNRSNATTSYTGLL
jgi:hypothetical protein